MPTAPTALQWPPPWLAADPPAAEEDAPAAKPSPPAARPVAQLVGDLRRRGHHLYVFGERLWVVPGLPADVREEVKGRKAEVREYLTNEPQPRPCYAANGVPVCAHCANPFRPHRAQPALCPACSTVAGLNAIEGQARPAPVSQAAPGDGDQPDGPDAEAARRAAVERLLSMDLT